MNRRQIREQLFMLLFRVEFHSREDMTEQEKLFFEGNDAPVGEDAVYVDAKYNRIMEHLDEIDGMLNEKTEGWNVSRIGKAEISILRLAVYEIRFDDDVPTSVAINEAVELAKKYGQDQSAGFVNGVLAKFA
jgi:N utilization substance protein B